MTVEEYDSKAGLRNAIDEKDKALYAISKLEEEPDEMCFGLGSIWSTFAMDVYCAISEPKITRRFKQLLIERKKELVEEFSR